MSTQFTVSAGLPYWQQGDRNWHVQFQNAMQQLDNWLVGQLAVCPKDLVAGATALLPSNSLYVNVAAGTFISSVGLKVAFAGATNQLLVASSTNYVYITDAGALTINQTGFPATWHVPLATVITNTTVITAINDQRTICGSLGINRNTLYLALTGGTFTDGSGVVTVGTGTTNGTKIGSASTDKLAFYGATPIVQPANTVEIVTLLGNLGLRATGGNPALNLGTGAITCGALSPSGTITVTDGQNIVLGTTTGTQIGTTIGQKIGFLGATPVFQQANSTDLGVVLSNFGLRASGGNPNLNLGSGIINCGQIQIADGNNIVLGTTTGTKIGANSSNKLAFFGAVPITQQANTAGVVTASASYTATERAMLNDCYSVLRNLGLLS